MKSIIVFGPQGCGKSVQSAQLMRHFGATSVVEDWCPGDGLQRGVLHLTHVRPPATLRGGCLYDFADLVAKGVVQDMRSASTR